MVFPWDSSGKNAVVCCHSIFQGIFLTQGLNPGILHYRRILYHLIHLGSPKWCLTHGESDSVSHSVVFDSLQPHELYTTRLECPGRHQATLSMGFSRQEYWSGLPCPSLGDLRNPGIEPTSLLSPALAGGFFTTSATWETTYTYLSWSILPI